MSLNSTPNSERLHIAFFGLRNAGKSSLVNAVTGQALSVVSDVKGTTTDPVSKAMELLPLGPVLITDTAGFDDEGALGELRIKKTNEILRKTDIAVLVVDALLGKTEKDGELISLFKEKSLPFIIAYNKCELIETPETMGENEIYVSAEKGININELKEKIATMKPQIKEQRIIGDLIDTGDVVVLVTPIDESAPKGRIILPQQQTIRDILDSNALVFVTKETEFTQTLSALAKKPRLVITDSQVFGIISKLCPEDIPLTSFSILMARQKGFLDVAVKGVTAIDKLKDGDTVLISEGCTHHRQCGDIGSVKLPNLLKKYTGKNLKIELTSGGEFPEDLSKYSLVLHCGGCMLNQKELIYRKNHSNKASVPFTNYGIAIAYMTGILERSIKPLPEIYNAYLTAKGNTN